MVTNVKMEVPDISEKLLSYEKFLNETLKEDLR